MQYSVIDWNYFVENSQENDNICHMENQHFNGFRLTALATHNICESPRDQKFLRKQENWKFPADLLLITSVIINFSEVLDYGFWGLSYKLIPIVEYLFPCVASQLLYKCTSFYFSKINSIPFGLLIRSFDLVPHPIHFLHASALLLLQE